MCENTTHILDRRKSMSVAKCQPALERQDLAAHRQAYGRLSDEIRRSNDVHCNQETTSAPCSDSVSYPIHHCPGLQQSDPEIWGRLIERLPRHENVPDLLTIHAPREISANVDLMDAACRNKMLNRVVDVTLATSRDFIATLLRHEPQALLYLQLRQTN